MPRSLLVPAMLAAAVFAPALVCFPSVASVARAQDGILAELYGSGVHAYYSNDYPKAFDLLSRAIEGGLDDPRAYYFRGLTNMATGRPDEAEADFQAGAEIEALGSFGAAVGRSLTRVQGSQRLQIEQYRQQARLEKKTEATAQAQRRYSDAQRSEAQVLRAQPQPRTAPTLPTRRPAPVVPPDAPTPFDSDAIAGGEPTVQAADALGDPFVDEQPAAAAAAGAAPAAAAAEPDPFGGGAPADGTVDPFATPPATGSGDPFATPPADSDPFGESPF